MPIRPYLDGHRFDDETTRLMGIAFETAVAAVRQRDGVDDPPRDRIAKAIIDLAQAGERDPERLWEAALNALGKPLVGITDPTPLPPARPDRSRGLSIRGRAGTLGA
jgi:hypothetical protein